VLRYLWILLTLLCALPAHAQSADAIISAVRRNLRVSAETELTIATGAITATQSHHTIDTEADAASDTLETISGGVTGQLYLFGASNDARSVIVDCGTGNIECPGDEDFTLAEDDDYFVTIYDGANHVVVGVKLFAGTLGAADATATAAGVAELATQAEVRTGTDGVRIVTPGTLRGRDDILVKTASDTLTTADAFRLITNEGAGAIVELTLPAAAAGVGPFTVYVQNAVGIRFKAGAGDTLRGYDQESAAAGTAACTVEGCALTIRAINDTEYVVVWGLGVWTFT
jgi:hypothetical protein